MNTNIRILFLGREFGLIVRDKLKEAGYNLVDLKDQQVDLIVVGFYGEMLPEAMLEKPRYGALNVHPSLLPKYRGPTPVPATILKGDAKTGVSIILMDEKADHGPLLAQREFSTFDFQFSNGLGKPTTPELRKVLWELGGDLLLETIPKWIKGDIKPREQDHSKATYTKKLQRADGRIDWSKSAVSIERQARAYVPWPGTYANSQFQISNSQTISKRIKILKGKLLSAEKGRERKPGETFLSEDGFLAVQCRKDALIVEELQMEGGKPMSSKEFLLGYRDFVGTIFS